MIKREKSVELLNKAVAMELTAVHQYMYFHFRCSDFGYEPLAGLFKRVSIQEMIHVEQLAERILYLGGDVKMTLAAPIKYYSEVSKMLEQSTRLEEETVAAYNQWAHECSQEGDSASKKLFEDLVAQEESHDDQFDTEAGNLLKFGDKYLALQSIERSKLVAVRDPED